MYARVAKPVIIAIDDDRGVLNAVDRDLHQKYGQNFRIIKAESGASALEALGKIKERGDEVALFLVDQRMPNMTGVQFLEKAVAIYSQAKKVLLTAYSDTEAAIKSINDIGLDYYLLKPWEPPEDNLYPILDDLLDDWKVNVHLPFEGIKVAATLWSPAAHAIKEFLVRHQIPYQWLDVDSDLAARKLVEEANDGKLVIPTVFATDGTVFPNPTIDQLADCVGVSRQVSRPFYDLVIIGAGPSGLAAAVYSASEGLKTLVIERDAPGGQAGTSPKIENYLGFPSGISGSELTRRAVTQARRFGAEIISACSAMRIRVEEPYRIVSISSGKEVSCHMVLISTGASFRLLDVPGAMELSGAGIYYGAAYTEATYYQGKEIVVVGGANSAGQGAMFLSRFAKKVTVLVRGEELSASQYLVDLLNQNPKIEVMYNTEVSKVFGKQKLEKIEVANSLTKEKTTINASAMFVFIGVKPQSDVVASLVQLDPKGFIITGRDLLKEGKKPVGWTLERDPFLLETSIPGIFAAGDIRSGTNPRVASATGEGAIAVALYWQYIKTLGST